MDNLMKLVVAALEWSYEVKAADVEAKWLERAAELLVLRHDTLWIIDGAGPSIEAPQTPPAEPGNGNKTETEPEWETVPVNHELVNALKCEQVLPSNVSTCPQS